MQNFLNISSLFILLFCSGIMNAQLFTKSDYAKMSLCFVAGASDGVHEALWYHYDNFKRVHPNANDNYWNPYISSNNMNNTTVWNRTLGRGFADGNHTTRWIDRNSMLSALTISGLSNGKNYWGYIFDFVKFFIVRSLGFTLTYNIIYK